MARFLHWLFTAIREGLFRIDVRHPQKWGDQSHHVGYIECFLHKDPLDFASESTSSAENCLFEFNDSSDNLYKQRATIFHHMPSKSHFLFKEFLPKNRIMAGITSECF